MLDQHLDALLSALSGRRMWRHLEVFDRHTKFSGSPEEIESLRYVEADMRDAGYRTEILLHDAYISLPGKAKVTVDNADVACIAQSFSRASPPEGLTTTAIYLGVGGDDDFSKHDVEGKIVVLEGIANPVMARRASRAGAAGQLHISPHQYRHEMCVSPVWGSPTHETKENLPSTVITTVANADGEAIKAKLASRPDLRITLHAEVDTGWRKTPILVADLPSLEGAEDEPFVLFTGHHDAWYEGTMDNGGANATMMEVARLAAEKRSSWKRGLRVIFWSGHSHGRYSGSSWYAETHWRELEERAVAHVNVDSTGGEGNTVVANTTASAELRGLAREAIRIQGDQEFAGKRMGRAGDQSFWGIGVPSIYGNMSEQPPDESLNASASLFGNAKRLAHGTGWWWHTPHDRLDKMDEAILVRDTRIYLHTVWRLLTELVLPLDYAEHGRYLKAELDTLQAAAVDSFDLSPLIDRAKALIEAADQLNAVARQVADPEGADIVNGTLMAVSRALVPVDYSTGDRFGQDPATPQGVYPALQPIRGFAKLAAESDDAKFLTVGMTRARNRVTAALDDAINAIEQGLGVLSREQGRTRAGR
jgi:hypothetical protein